MIKVLIVKISSMGDLIHALPAVTDAKKALPNIQFGWVAEENFAEIPLWHPAVDKVISIALRRWKKNPAKSIKSGECYHFIKTLKEQKYDYIIDAQGLLKSACVSRLAKGLRCGMTAASCKEPLAALLYNKRYAISKQAHAIVRIRLLFANLLGYSFQGNTLDYGLPRSCFKAQNVQKPYLVFLHGSSIDNKLWPLAQWVALTKYALTQDYTVYLPWGNQQQKARAEKIATPYAACHVLPKMNLTDIAGLLAHAAGVVGVDTGLAHLAAALTVPSITLYTDTHPQYTGACGNHQLCLSKLKLDTPIAPPPIGLEVIYDPTLQADTVWRQLTIRIS